ncbi:hypothetical protein M7I_6939 [Glarea lozoyensis 74030]|uniref:Uncharacterized protein n=1 Tax=Glarea lozoyensis (strain ATCC 74030 / MF5533) TaxID=1104152 RepID=H0EVY2_GLAL7|nr:hypothetical protein M7I_6939 [Glarea lozoyensis 74030]
MVESKKKIAGIDRLFAQIDSFMMFCVGSSPSIWENQVLKDSCLCETNSTALLNRVMLKLIESSRYRPRNQKLDCPYDMGSTRRISDFEGLGIG